MAEGRGVWCKVKEVWHKVEGCGRRKRGVVQGKGGVAQGRGSVAQVRGVWCKGNTWTVLTLFILHCAVQLLHIQFKHACSIARDPGTQSTLMNVW